MATPGISKNYEPERAQIRRAVIALTSFLTKKESSKKNLFANSTILSLQIARKKVPEKKPTKPIAIKIPHSLFAETSEICLFVKNDDKARVKELLEIKPIPQVTKVMTIEKLKSHHSRFEDRRKLAGSYDMFLCDDRILPQLTGPLGKSFFRCKKQPIPIRIAKTTNIALKVQNALNASYLIVNSGTCNNLKIGYLGMDVEEITDNIVEGMKGLADRIPKRWNGIQSINLKAPDSVSLPIFNSLPAVPFKVAASSKVEEPADEKVPEKKKRVIKVKVEDPSDVKVPEKKGAIKRKTVDEKRGAKKSKKSKKDQ